MITWIALTAGFAAINVGIVVLIHRAEIREHARRRKGGQYSEGDVGEASGSVSHVGAVQHVE